MHGELTPAERGEEADFVILAAITTFGQRIFAALIDRFPSLASAMRF